MRKFNGIIALSLITLGALWWGSLGEQKLGGAPTLSIDGRRVLFEWTDDNVGEDLIIYSSVKDFSGLGTAVAYFAVQNNSGQNQNINLVFSTGKIVPNAIYIYSGEETVEETKPIFIETEENTATGTRKIFTEGTKKTKTTKTIWNPLTKTEPKREGDYPFKDVEGSQKGASAISSTDGQWTYFKVEFSTSKFGTLNEEFYVEAFGSLGAYGHLDPQVGTIENFEGLNLADLGGQNSWVNESGSAWDVDNSQSQEGSQSAKSDAAAAGLTTKAIGAYTTETITYHARISNTTSNEVIQQRFYDGNTLIFRLNWGAGTLKLNTLGVTADQTVGTYSADTWYKIDVTVDAAGDTVTADMDDGTPAVATANAYADIDEIGLYQDAAGTNSWVDNINDGLVAAAPYRQPAVYIIDTGE